MTAVVDRLRTLVMAYAPRNDVREIAVVGNAPLEPSDERAAAVDACDLVLRVNGFALDEPGEPAVAGRRADVVVFNRGVRPTPWVFRDYRSRLYLLVEPGRMHWEPEIIPAWWPPDLGWVAVPNRDVVVPLSHALGLDSLAEPHWATTGTTSAWLAHLLFPAATLHLAGFSFLTDPHQTEWTHRYDSPSIVGPEHLLAVEQTLLAGWVADGRIVVHE